MSVLTLSTKRTVIVTSDALCKLTKIAINEMVGDGPAQCMVDINDLCLLNFCCKRALAKGLTEITMVMGVKAIDNDMVLITKLPHDEYMVTVLAYRCSGEIARSATMNASEFKAFMALLEMNVDHLRALAGTTTDDDEDDEDDEDGVIY